MLEGSGRTFYRQSVSKPTLAPGGIPKAARGSGSRNVKTREARHIDTQECPWTFKGTVVTPSVLSGHRYSARGPNNCTKGSNLAYVLVPWAIFDKYSSSVFCVFFYLTLSYRHLASCFCSFEFPAQLCRDPPPTPFNSPHSPSPPPRRPWCGQTPEDELRFTPRNVLLSPHISMHIRKTATSIFRVTLICQSSSFSLILVIRPGLSSPRVL